jgi:hypothetical protein
MMRTNDLPHRIENNFRVVEKKPSDFMSTVSFRRSDRMAEPGNMPVFNQPFPDVADCPPTKNAFHSQAIPTERVKRHIDRPHCSLPHYST